ncbi:MAG: flotillin family protein [Deltaproteobacteria bacterium]|nr:flotillin family protein [Deltaproteobacteria bacterium]
MAPPSYTLPEELGGLDPTTAMGLLLIALLVVVGFALLIWILTRFLYVCRPNEILIFAGRKHQLPDGSTVGYRILHGGRAVRIPLLETVARMDMRLVPVELAVQGAYSRGGIPLTVNAIANVKLSSDPTLVRNAVERFLGTGMEQIAVVAQQTLEGVLREVLAQLTPEEVNEDRLKFAQTLMLNAKDDFDTLGLELDVLKVQHVSDDQHYLANLGRARIAEMIRDAKNAENSADQRIKEEQAQARQRAEMAQKVAETRVLQRRNEVRAELARLEAEVRSVENEALVAAETARATAEQVLQQQRAELEKLRLECDVVLPAEARRMAEESKARGDAAPFLENGRASAAALGAVSQEWQAAGSDGKDLYVLQELGTLVEAAIARVNATTVQNMDIVDGGDGASYGSLIASYPAAVAKVLEETGRAMGIDLAALMGAKKEEAR